ncbi:zinc finger BED domain-containing protein RICESLEEPER 2-like [Canna indica]|uniref:Zinc finger BED domain-containing protein RICESLEEPER 2-like n=1 Tax=Canna indica TaxID=4628 RepID=A0AAQ3K3Y6_9LILI|nr:zinc finger BED domain-containing protein RICESLEEPER 2-like [Canna indica]
MEFLEVFNEATNVFSGYEYPTANLFLPEVWKIKELLELTVVDDCQYMKAMAFKMKDKFDKYWDAIYDLYNYYVVMYKSQQPSQRNMDSEFDMWSQSVESVTPSKSDLDAYLEEGRYICTNGESFDALQRWKANTLKFKILSKMTKDVLSISVTTVASESTFSAGGRVLDQYRSSLKPEIVQALLCTANWLKNDYKIVNFTSYMVI